jgi:thiol:disulfide interchange protein
LIAFAVLAIGLLSIRPVLNLVGDRAQPRAAVRWGGDLQEALGASRMAGKPVLLVLSATWCPPCQEMKRSVWSRTDVADLVHASYLPVHLDVDSEAGRTAGRQYAVDVIPTVLVLGADGTPVRGAEFMSAEQTLAFLRK